MPTKIGGGKKPQEYDPSNGRYGCSADGYTKNYEKAVTILSTFSTTSGSCQTSKLMPGYKKAITPNKKFLDYSLNDNHPVGKHKAHVYKTVLGYTKDNYESLKTQIHQSVITGAAKLESIGQNEFGTIKFKYIIPVKGPNGSTANVVVVYGFNKTDGRPRMITNYLK